MSCSWAGVLYIVAGVLLSTGVVDARPEIHGHRGARARLPENTLAGFRYAIGAGADVLELDLHATRDEALVAIHDAHISPARCLWSDGRTLKSALAVRELDLATLRRLDCGRKHHPRFPRQKRLQASKIPTLDEVLAATKSGRTRGGRPIRYNIEMKSVPSLPHLSPSPRHFATLVVKVLRKHRLIERTVLQSFDARTLRAARRLAPRIRLALLTGENHVDYVALAKAHAVQIISPNHRWILRADVQRLHRHKVEVIPWTANAKVEWQRLLRLGVDGIITDDPAALRTFLDKRLKDPPRAGQ